MAQMKARYPSIPKGISLYRERTSCIYRVCKHGETSSTVAHNVRRSRRRREKRNSEREREFFFDISRGLSQFTCTSTNLLGINPVTHLRGTEREFMVQSSSSSTEEEVEKIEKLDGENGDGKGQFGNLVREYGWKVRRMVEEESEMRKVAQVQAEAFHVPVALFNRLFLQLFQVEVLSGLLYRIRNSPPDRYACLVAESNTDDSAESRQELVGVVDVMVLRDEDVLQHLHGAKEYLYVSGIAVLNNFRRRKVGTALLKACEKVSILWGYEYLVLRAYEDDLGALKLYGNGGYTIVSGDPSWMSTWIGRKRRVLMIKRSISCS